MTPINTTTPSSVLYSTHFDKDYLCFKGPRTCIDRMYQVLQALFLQSFEHQRIVRRSPDQKIILLQKSSPAKTPTCCRQKLLTGIALLLPLALTLLDLATPYTSSILMICGILFTLFAFVLYRILQTRYTYIHLPFPISRANHSVPSPLGSIKKTLQVELKESNQVCKIANDEQRQVKNSDEPIQLSIHPQKNDTTVTTCPSKQCPNNISKLRSFIIQRIHQGEQQAIDSTHSEYFHMPRNPALPTLPNYYQKFFEVPEPKQCPNNISELRSLIIQRIHQGEQQAIDSTRSEYFHMFCHLARPKRPQTNYPILSQYDTLSNCYQKFVEVPGPKECSEFASLFQHYCELELQRNKEP